MYPAIAVYEATPLVNLSSVPAVIFMLLSVLAIVSSGIVVVRSSLFKTQIEALRSDRDDILKRLDRAREDNDDCTTKYEQIRVKLDLEQQKRMALEQVVTGKQELQSVLEILHRLDKRHDRVERLVKDLARDDSNGD